MKIHTNNDGERERRILIGLLTNDLVCGRIASKSNGKLFFASVSNKLANWACAYYHKHGQAPGRNIETIFQAKADKLDKETSQGIETLLSSLSEEYVHSEEINADHLIDIAGEHLNRVRLSRLRDGLDQQLELGEVEKATGLVVAHKKIELGVGAALDWTTDPEPLIASFQLQENANMFSLKGALGKFFRGMLERDSFLALLGPEKSGKTYNLIELAYQAALQRRRVAFFEAGDMSQHQILRRMATRVARHPLFSTNADGSWPCKVRWPLKMVLDGSGVAEVSEFKELTFDRPLNFEIAWAKCQQVVREKIKSDESYFKLSVHPNVSLNVEGMESIMDEWEVNGWKADVVVVDYADILAPPTRASRFDRRDQINATWENLRKLSEERHCCLITATQATRESYDKPLLNRRHASEDKRKLAHTTGVLAINVTPKEKDRGIQRLNWVVRREGESNWTRVVHVAQCLAVANPCVLSIEDNPKTVEDD